MLVAMRSLQRLYKQLRKRIPKYMRTDDHGFHHHLLPATQCSARACRERARYAARGRATGAYSRAIVRPRAPPAPRRDATRSARYTFVTYRYAITLEVAAEWELRQLDTSSEIGIAARDSEARHGLT